MCCCRFHSWWKRIEGLVEGGGGMDKGQPQEKGKEEVEGGGGGGIDGTTDGASSSPFG